MKIDDTVWVAPTSVQYGDVEVGEYSGLWPSSVMRGDFAPVRVGGFSNIQDNVTIHAALIGDMVTVAHNSVVHACKVADRCMIGIGAVVPEGTEVPPGSLVIGVPAKVKPGKPTQEGRIVMNAVVYAALAQVYKSGADPEDKNELGKWMAEIRKLAGLDK